MCMFFWFFLNASIGHFLNTSIKILDLLNCLGFLLLFVPFFPLLNLVTPLSQWVRRHSKTMLSNDFNLHFKKRKAA